MKINHIHKQLAYYHCVVSYIFRFFANNLDFYTQTNSRLEEIDINTIFYSSY
jgi:hypothetical protein